MNPHWSRRRWASRHRKIPSNQPARVPPRHDTEKSPASRLQSTPSSELFSTREPNTTLIEGTASLTHSTRYRYPSWQLLGFDYAPGDAALVDPEWLAIIAHDGSWRIAFQQIDAQIYADPAGHPFCIFLGA